MWYDINRTLTYNALFNFIIGNRGSGKTYGFKDWAIRDFLKNGNQFVYVRRYKQELKNISKYFNDILDKYPDHEFEIKGNTFFIDRKIAGWNMPLSTAKIQKSVSYPKVNKICYDEFILDKGVYRYLADEVVNFLELYETIARMRDVRVFFLSNAISITNPYFLYFDISLPYGSKIMKRDDILIELVKDEEFIAEKEVTRFAKLIAGTPYADYAINNTFLRDDKNFVQRKTPNSEYYFTFIYNEKQYGVWVDYKAGIMTVSENVDPTCINVYAMTTADHTPNTMFLKSKRQSYLFTNFVEQYKIGNVRFESVNIKNICYQIIKNTLL